MAGYTAADVKKLRDETDAPIMDCKSALEEADGDLEKAKNVLREKGKVAAAKRSGRSTGAGVVAFASKDNGKTVGGVVLESETDFVARTEDFIELAQHIAEAVRDSESFDPADVQGPINEAVGKMRENIRISRNVQLRSPNPITTYVHHDRSKGAAVATDPYAGDAARQLAIQAVAFPPEVVSKEQLPQEKIAQEIEVETQRAMNEGKPENIARNIATGRVNKEYVKRAVLLEQPYYKDPNKSVSQFLGEEAKDAKVVEFAYLAVGQGE